MPQFVIGVSYDGGAFRGWQRQTDVPSVQGALEKAASRIANQPVVFHVAGRTDAGVHATGQVASFSSTAQRSLQDWQRGLNGLTGNEVRVHWVRQISDDFHPRFRATARQYTYLFCDYGYVDPLVSGRAWQCDALDADAMHRAAQLLIGEHDFSSFRGSGCQSLTPMRRVHYCTVRRQGHWIAMQIEANAFVLHMVRNIAAGLYAVGNGSADQTLDRLLAVRDRQQLGPTAPAEGLYLTRVSYPEFDLPPPAPLPWLAA